MRDNTRTPDAAKAMRMAATVLLLREGGNGMEIFMVQRHHQIEFSSGASAAKKMP